MNTYARRAGFTLYANTRIEKRNPYKASQKMLYKNIQAARSTGSAGTGTAAPAVDAIIRFFKGTVVNTDVSGIEWGIR